METTNVANLTRQLGALYRTNMSCSNVIELTECFQSVPQRVVMALKFVFDLMLSPGELSPPSGLEVGPTKWG